MPASGEVVPGGLSVDRRGDDQVSKQGLYYPGPDDMWARRPPAELGIEEGPGSLFTVPATEIARRCLGRPMPGAPLLGGFAGLSEAITLGALAKAIRERFAGELGEGNVAAANEAHEYVRGEIGAAAGA